MGMRLANGNWSDALADTPENQARYGAGSGFGGNYGYNGPQDAPGRPGSAGTSGGSQQSPVMAPNNPVNPNTAPPAFGTPNYIKNTLQGAGYASNTPGTPGASPLQGNALQNWQFDPTAPDRAISNAMALLGLPAFGPLNTFLTQYGIPGLTASIAGNDFANPGSFQTAMQNRMQGATTPMSSGQMIGSLTGAEDLARQMAQNPNLVTDPTSAARAAYMASLQSNPQQLANMLASTFAANGSMGLGISGMLGNFLGTIGQRQFNLGNINNNAFGFLSKMLGY